MISSLSISFSYSSWFSLSLAIPISMVAISTIAMGVAMGVVSWVSNSCSEESKRDSNLKLSMFC
jgi:hypothetical protein